MYTFNNEVGDNNTQNPQPATLRAMLTLMMPATCHEKAKWTEMIGDLRKITQELSEDIAVLREKIFSQKSAMAIKSDLRKEEATSISTVISTKAQGMIHHLKHTKNSISLN